MEPNVKEEQQWRAAALQWHFGILASAKLEMGMWGKQGQGELRAEKLLNSSAQARCSALLVLL